jgi:hypothetical protein
VGAVLRVNEMIEEMEVRGAVPSPETKLAKVKVPAKAKSAGKVPKSAAAKKT